MKKKFIFLLLLIIVSVFGYLYFVNKNILTTIQFDTQKVTYGGEKDMYSIVGEYPVIMSGIPNTAKEKINKELKDFAKTDAEKAKGDFDDLVKTPEAVSHAVSLTYLSKVTLQYDFSKLPILNVSFETYYYSGGAHGITAISTFIFNAKTGEKLTAQNVFKGDYLNAFSVLSLRALKEKDPNLETYIFAEEGTTPDAANFENFTLEPLGVRILFGDYQVAPYSAGLSSIMIPYNSLWENLSDSFKALIDLK